MTFLIAISCFSKDALLSNVNGKEQNSRCKNQTQTSFHNVQVNIFFVIRSHGKEIAGNFI